MERSLVPQVKQRVYTVDALAGSGKTYQALGYAFEQTQLGNKVCIVQPTIELIKQSVKDFEDRFGTSIPIKQFHSESRDVDDSVKYTAMEYLKSPIEDGQVIFMTHSAFFSLPYFHDKHEWIVICDEIPNVIQTFDKCLVDSHQLITEDLARIDHDELHYQLKRSFPQASLTGDLTRVAENRNRDDVFEVLKELAEKINSRHHQVFIRKEHWERTIQGKTEYNRYKFTCHSVLQPSIFRRFKKSIIMGAMFQDSLLFKLWKNRVDFVSMTEIESKLRFSKHQVKGSLIIKYLVDGPWSKSFLNKEDGGVQTLNACASIITQEFGDRKFIYSCNKDSQPFRNNRNCERLNGSPHGLNQYQHYHNAAFLSALNPIPATFSFLETKDVSEDEIIDAIMGQACYQAIMRISLRDPAATADRVVIVPTKKMALWLAESFDNVTTEQIPSGLTLNLPKEGRPRKATALESYERVRKHRRKNIISGVLELNRDLELEINKDVGGNVTIDRNNCEHCNEKSIDPIRFTLQEQFESELTIRLQLFKSVATSPDDDLILELPNEGSLIDYLEECSKREVLHKDLNSLISPATFGDIYNKNGERARTIENVKSAWGIWIDIDTGDLQPDDFPLIFPGMRMYIFNTYSGGDRFRVLIPTDCYMTAAAYSDIHSSLKYVVEQSLSVRQDDRRQEVHSGWDRSTMHAAALFYLPCRAKTGDVDSFFRRVDGEPLSVLNWLQNPRHTKPRKTRAKSRNRKSILKIDCIDQKIDEYVNQYRSVGAGKGLRNDAFYKLGLKLAGLGLSDEETAQHLIKADYDGSRVSKKQIESVIRSLHAYGQFKHKYTGTTH